MIIHIYAPDQTLAEKVDFGQGNEKYCFGIFPPPGSKENIPDVVIVDARFSGAIGFLRTIKQEECWHPALRIVVTPQRYMPDFKGLARDIFGLETLDHKFFALHVTELAKAKAAAQTRQKRQAVKS